MDFIGSSFNIFIIYEINIKKTGSLKMFLNNLSLIVNSVCVFVSQVYKNFMKTNFVKQKSAFI